MQQAYSLHAKRQSNFNGLHKKALALSTRRTIFTRNIFEAVNFKEIKMSFAWDAAPCSVVEIY